jgi:hypothetical protein
MRWRKWVILRITLSASVQTKAWDHSDILIKNKFQVNNIRVKLGFIQSGSYKQTSWQTIKDETFEGVILNEQVPNGAYNVELFVERYELFNGWAEWKHYDLFHVSADESCWEAYYNGGGDKAFRTCP